MAVLGAAVLVSACAAWALSAQAGKSIQLAPLVRILGENAGASD